MRSLAKIPLHVLSSPFYIFSPCQKNACMRAVFFSIKIYACLFCYSFCYSLSDIVHNHYCTMQRTLRLNNFFLFCFLGRWTHVSRPKIRRGTRCAHQFWAQAAGCLRARGSKSADLTIFAASQAGSRRACTACTKID